MDSAAADTAEVVVVDLAYYWAHICTAWSLAASEVVCVPTLAVGVFPDDKMALVD